MVAKLTRLTHKIAIQLHVVAESCTICSFHSRQPVQKLLKTPLYHKSRMAFPLLHFKSCSVTLLHSNLLCCLMWNFYLSRC